MVAFQVVALGFWSQLCDLVQMCPDHVDFILQPVDSCGVFVVGADGVTVGAVPEVDDGVRLYVLDDREEDVEGWLAMVREVGIPIYHCPSGRRITTLRRGGDRYGKRRGLEIQHHSNSGPLDDWSDDGFGDIVDLSFGFGVEPGRGVPVLESQLLGDGLPPQSFVISESDDVTQWMASWRRYPPTK